MPTSVIPASRIASSAWNRMGAPATGISCLALVCVSGRSRDPSPPRQDERPHQPSDGMQLVEPPPLPTGCRLNPPVMKTATGLPRNV